MAQYFDAKKVKTKINYLLKTYVSSPQLANKFKDALASIPTVDVVPKREVVKALNEVDLLIIITKEMYKQQMEDAPNELSKQSKLTKWVAFEKFYEQFSELKKKYT